jgi:phosphotriesterase-related protein
VLVSQDTAKPGSYRANGGPGYGHLFRSFVPLLREAGLDDTAVRQLLEVNPATALAVPHWPVAA